MVLLAQWHSALRVEKERVTRDAKLIDMTQRRNFCFEEASPVATPPYDHTWQTIIIITLLNTNIIRNVLSSLVRFTPRGISDQNFCYNLVEPNRLNGQENSYKQRYGQGFIKPWRVQGIYFNSLLLFMYNVHAFFNGSQYILVDLSFSFFMGLCSYSTLSVLFQDSCLVRTRRSSSLLSDINPFRIWLLWILNKRVKGHSIASIFPVFLKDLPKPCVTV